MKKYIESNFPLSQYDCLIFSCDGTIKTIENPLESDDFVVLLQHDHEIETLVTDENNVFYCGWFKIDQIKKLFFKLYSLLKETIKEEFQFLRMENSSL